MSSFSLFIALLLLIPKLSIAGLPDVVFRIFGNGDPVVGARVLVKTSTPGCANSRGTLVYQTIGETDINGNVMLSEAGLKERLRSQCAPCPCWAGGETEIRYKVIIEGFKRLEGQALFASRQGSYDNEYYVDVMLEKDTAAYPESLRKKWGRYEIKTPPVPGNAYYMEKGVWVSRPAAGTNRDSIVTLRLKILVKSLADRNALSGVSHFYAWGEDVECGDACVSGEEGEYHVVLGKKPAVYNLSNYPKTCRVRLSRVGYHSFEDDIPLSNLSASEEVIEILMEPLY